MSTIIPEVVARASQEARTWCLAEGGLNFESADVEKAVVGAGAAAVADAAGAAVVAAAAASGTAAGSARGGRPGRGPAARG